MSKCVVEMPLNRPRLVSGFQITKKTSVCYARREIEREWERERGAGAETEREFKAVGQVCVSVLYV